MNQIVYISSSKSQQIHVWHLNIKGSLTLIQIVDVPGEVKPMLISPDKNYLYVGVGPIFRVITYRIFPKNGMLSWVTELFLPCSPTYISTDYYGKLLFICSYYKHCICFIQIRNGIPQNIINIIEGLEGCHSARVSPDQHTLWALALKQDRIYFFTFNNQGILIKKLTEITITKGAGPRHIVFHPNKKYAYTINELNSSIDVWLLKESSKNVINIQTINMMPCNFSGNCWASDIHVTPNGCYLYACDRSASSITIFNISKNDGTLKIIGFQSTEAQPRGFNIDLSGRYLIVAGQKSNHITVYEIGNHGFLKEKNRYAVGREPIWIVINSN